MPTLTISVVDLPEACLGYEGFELRLCVGDDRLPGDRQPDGALQFEFPFELKADRSGVIQASGTGVQRGSDGRRFIYLSWIGKRTGGTYDMYGRIKVFFEQVPGFPEGDAFSIRIHGRDKKGRPACATAVLA